MTEPSELDALMVPITSWPAEAEYPDEEVLGDMIGVMRAQGLFADPSPMWALANGYARSGQLKVAWMVVILGAVASQDL